MPPGVILAIACVANFMVIIDTSIVNVALPAMKTALGLSAADQQWVVDAYLITFGGFLLLAARAGDLFGRKGVFQAGLTVFTAASLAGGLAQDPWLLIAARVLQGIGAAALASSSLSLITASHPEGPARTRALSLWAAVGSSAGAVGVVLGGLLTTELSWRYVLFINVPIGVALLIAAGASLVPSPPRRGPGPPRPAGRAHRHRRGQRPGLRRLPGHQQGVGIDPRHRRPDRRRGPPGRLRP